MKRVLVTGASGFIGRWVVAELSSRGIEPVLYDLPCSVLDVGELRAALYDTEGVINLAGVLGTPETFGDEQRAVGVNILGALNVYDAAKSRGIPVVQIGTGHKGHLNPYAITKGAAEDIGMARARYLGDLITIVRAFHVYGPGQQPCSPHGSARVRKIIPSFICRALTGMPVEVTGQGGQLVDLVYVEDVARVLVDALDAPAGALLEAGTGKPARVYDVARTVIDACSSASGVTFGLERVGEPPDATVVADSPACSNPWPYRLAETIDWYRGMLR